MFWTIVLWVASFALQILLTPKPQNAKAASLEDFEAPTAEDGREIPVLFGTRVIAGPNVVWYGDLRKASIKGPRRYGFFGPRSTIGHKYYIGMHMGLCHGPADKVTEIRVGQKVAWSGLTTGGAITIDEPKLFGGTEAGREGGISGTVDIEMGEPTQDKNDYLQAKLGAGVPAFRGVVCAVLRQCYIGTSTYLKPWDFRIQRIYLTSSGAEQWYPEKAGIAGGFRLTWYQRANDGTDKGRLGLEFYDNVGAPIGDIVWSAYSSEESWTLRMLTALVPTGAEDVRIYIDLRRNGGSSNDCFIDDIILSMDSVALAITNPGAESGTATGWTSTVGTLTAIEDTDEDPHAGSWCFYGGPNAITTAYQLIPLDAVAAEIIVPQHLDMNPAHIIRECLTDRLWGMGYNGSDMDDDSFTEVADALYTEGFGLTLLWQREEEVATFMTTVLSHIDAMLYTSRETGKFVLKLIRPDYSIDDLQIIDEDDIISWGEVKRRQPSETVNSVSVVYYSTEKAQDASIAVHNVAQIHQSGGIISATRQYPGIGYKELAVRVATRDVRSLGAGLADGLIVGKRTIEGLNPGDAFRLVSTNHNFTGEVMRVIETRHGDGRQNGVSMRFVQDVFSMEANTVVDDSTTDWENPISEPLPVTPRLVEEMPWHELVKHVGRVNADDMLTTDVDFGCLFLAGGSPSSDALSASIWIDLGAGFTETVESIYFAPHAVLDAALTTAATDEDVAIEDIAEEDEITVGMLAWIGGEIVQVTDLTAGVLTITRGCLDTVPVAHDIGDPIIFYDGFIATDFDPYTDTDDVDVKMLTLTGLGALAGVDAPTDTVDMSSRAYRPYPPGKFRVDGSYTPGSIGATASLTWTHRDRLGQTGVFGHDAASQGPEASTTYRVDIYGLNGGGGVIGGVPFVSTNVGALLIYSFDQGTDPPPVGTVSVRMKVTSVRDGYDSFQSPVIEATI